MLAANVQRYTVSTFHYVYIVTLDDGTKCALYSAPEKGGIDCNWKD